MVATPLQLPGRERRLDEEPYRDLHAAAEGLLPAALKAAGSGPVALFGHCFLGAALAYELTRRITDTGCNGVAHLFVSAARPPSTSAPSPPTSAPTPKAGTTARSPGGGAKSSGRCYGSRTPPPS
ncbi:thioesterase II family protein [Streptomyces sp. NPDC051217]|uniref:thioesterase II family protein n=1 Tax=Streptomyces sp. NPDC051217 TaxID=3365644 RepID=UPI00378F9350